MKAREATDLQRQSYEAVVRLGSQSAAAKELGRHQGSIRADAIRYAEITGSPLPDGVSGARRAPSAAMILAGVPQRLDRIEDDVAGLRAEVARLAGLLATFVDRQPVILTVGPRHERKADGGQGGRSEARELRRVVGG